MRSHPAPQPRYSWVWMPAPSLLDHPILEPLLLRRAARRAEGFSDAQRARMRPYLSLAEQQYRTALELRDDATRIVVWGLLRDAAFHALLALESASDGALSSSLHRAWEGLGARAEAPAALERVRLVLASEDALVEIATSTVDLDELRPGAEETVAWLLGLAEVRSPKQIARLRALRVALFALASVLVLWALVSYWLALSALSLPPRER
jgi:hypothetical protein